MIKEIIQILWLFLPAIFADMIPIFARKIRFLNKPINKKLFGSHKTWKGIVFGIIIAIIIAALQKVVVIPSEYLLIDYNIINCLLFGGMVGLGVGIGDLVKSFFKRKLKISAGKPWLVADQVDWVIGSCIFILPFIILSWQMYVFAIILLGFLALLGEEIGYLLHIKEREI